MRRLDWVGATLVIGCDMVRVTLSGSQGVGTLHGLHVFNRDSLYAWSNATVKSLDDTSAAGVSCVRRMAAWRCDDKQRGGECFSNDTAPRLT